MTIKVTRPEGTVNFCTDLALRSEWEDAQEQLERIRQDDTDRRLADVTLVEAAQAVKDLEARMRASTLRFRMRALPRKQWQEIGAEHPPREDVAEDRGFGVNVSTFFDAVAKASIFAVLRTESDEVVDFDADAEWDGLADEMTNGQYQEFADEFLRLNRGVTAAPFSRTASLVTRDSDASSSSPKTSASVSSDSMAGPPSPDTNTTTTAG